MKLERVALLAVMLALITAGCADTTRDLQARLDQVSGEVQAQQLQINSLTVQSTNLEQRLKKLEAASSGAGQLMLGAQLHFTRLYHAAEARNWDLAGFERGELEENLKTATALRPEERGVNIAGIMDAFKNGPLTSLSDAIEVKDRPLFRKAYQDSVAMCNACHQSTGRPFIVITVPATPP